MGTFRYLAYDGAGNRTAGVMEAAGADHVKHLLWADGLFIVDIRDRTLALPHLDEIFPSLVRVRRSELILFTRQLATFVRVGVPILEGLAVLREQASSRIMRRTLNEVIRDVTTGSPLSSALAKFPKVFPGLYVELVRTAEVSGNLDETLRQLADYMSRDEAAARKVRGAMIYPAIVIGLALVVITILVGFVLPSFANLFRDFHAQLPWPTRLLLTIGGFSRDHKFTIFATLATVVGICVLYSRTRSGRELLDVAFLRMPVIGLLVRDAIVERYLRTLATLARSGVPIAQMLETANRSLGNVVFQRGLAQVRPRMLSGDGFAEPLAATHLFPRMVIQMIRVGEETGHLDSNLEEAADHYAEELDYRLKRMIAMLEPALVIIVGAVVGFIALSVIAPMYGLVRAIK